EVGFHVHERLRVEVLRIDRAPPDIREDLEPPVHPHVVAVAGHPVGDHTRPVLLGRERHDLHVPLDHPVRQNAHDRSASCGGRGPRRIIDPRRRRPSRSRHIDAAGRSLSQTQLWCSPPIRYNWCLRNSPGRRFARGRPRGLHMSPSLSLAVITFAAPVIDLPAKLWQVAPDNPAPPWLVTRKERAVVLVHGLRFHPLRRRTPATRPARHEWQEPRSELVKALAADADIYAFSYAQTVPLDAVAHSAGLREAVGQLRAAGYREIVLIGHSAGGVISRLFV